MQENTINRQKAVHRHRRIILNDDNGSIHQEISDNVKGYLSYRLAHTVGTQVDSIWLSIMTASEGLLYDTKVGEIAGSDPYPGTSKADLERYDQIWHNMKSLLNSGTDTLKIAVEFGHVNGKEVFASFRMNQIRDSWISNFFTRWKREHPEYCLGLRAEYPKNDLRYDYWSALDYEQQGVRDQRVAVINDICTRYDVDGMELDFRRWPMLFKPSLDNKPVEQKHIAIMNNFIRRIRERMLGIETERKRPLLLAARVFDTEQLCLRMGLDVSTWLKEGLIDILVVGGDYNYYSIPATDWSKLTHKYDVPLYICTYRSRGLEQDRAFATYYRSCGADGVYTFNFKMPKDVPSIKEIGDFELIARKDKHYVMNASVPYAMRNHVCAPGLTPVHLRQGVKHPVLLVGDDVQKAIADGVLKELTLRLSMANALSEEDKITFKLNGEALKYPRWKGKSVEFDVTAPPLEQGKNAIEAVFGKHTLCEVKLTGVELWVRYK